MTSFDINIPKIFSKDILIDFLEIKNDETKNHGIYSKKLINKGEIIFKELPIEVFLDNEYLEKEVDTSFNFNNNNYDLFSKENSFENKIKLNSFHCSLNHIGLNHQIIILFRLLSKINHSFNNYNCIIVPSFKNLIFNYFSGKEIVFSLVSLKDIYIGEELLISYINKDFITSEQVFNLKNQYDIIERPINIKEPLLNDDIHDTILNFYRKYSEIEIIYDNYDILKDFYFLEDYINNIFINFNNVFNNNILEIEDSINCKIIFLNNIHNLIKIIKKNVLMNEYKYIQIEIIFFENLIILNNSEIFEKLDNDIINNLILSTNSVFNFNENCIYDIFKAIIISNNDILQIQDSHHPIYNFKEKSIHEKKRSLKKYFDFILNCSLIKKN